MVPCGRSSFEYLSQACPRLKRDRAGGWLRRSHADDVHAEAIAALKPVARIATIAEVLAEVGAP
jgi:hypothetical protein